MAINKTIKLKQTIDRQKRMEFQILKAVQEFQEATGLRIPAIWFSSIGDEIVEVHTRIFLET